MKVEATEIEEVLLVAPAVFHDGRGYFLETWNSPRYGSLGLPTRFVQDNVSWSRGGVLRGLHFQHPRGQGKLVSAVRGEIFDVAVDVRVGSPTFGRWTGRVLSEANAHQLWVPPGFAHGFAVMSDEALVSYKCTEVYDREAETTLRWDDPQIGIRWPVPAPVLSDRDAAALVLNDLPRERLPTFAQSTAVDVPEAVASGSSRE
jgi:dTDP-4-dehydrorhamnose 3,5-epimerase